MRAGSRGGLPGWIYDRPRKIVRQDLHKPEGEIKHTLDMTQLRFKEWEGRPYRGPS